MAIKQRRKPVVLPPAHLYLEDIEEIVNLMIEAEKAKFKNMPKEETTLAFTVGKKQCDSIEDLKKIGGTWRHFEVAVNDRGNFKIDPLLGTEWHVYDTGKSFPQVLKLMTARESPVRSALRHIPYMALLIWSAVLLVIGNAMHPSKSWSETILVRLVFPYFVGAWVVYAHTIVELRYSHDPSPKLAVIKERGEKLLWMVVGSLVTLMTQLAWKHFFAQ
jgi:hypothetical protein